MSINTPTANGGLSKRVSFAVRLEEDFAGTDADTEANSPDNTPTQGNRLSQSPDFSARDNIDPETKGGIGNTLAKLKQDLELGPKNANNASPPLESPANVPENGQWSMSFFIDNICSVQGVAEQAAYASDSSPSKTTASAYTSESSPRKSPFASPHSSIYGGDADDEKEDDVDDEAFLPDSDACPEDEEAFLPPPESEEAFLPPEDEDFLPQNESAFLPTDEESSTFPLNEIDHVTDNEQEEEKGPKVENAQEDEKVESEEIEGQDKSINLKRDQDESDQDPDPIPSPTTTRSSSPRLQLDLEKEVEQVVRSKETPRRKKKRQIENEITQLEDLLRTKTESFYRCKSPQGRQEIKDLEELLRSKTETYYVDIDESDSEQSETSNDRYSFVEHEKGKQQERNILSTTKSSRARNNIVFQEGKMDVSKRTTSSVNNLEHQCPIRNMYSNHNDSNSNDDAEALQTAASDEQQVIKIAGAMRVANAIRNEFSADEEFREIKTLKSSLSNLLKNQKSNIDVLKKSLKTRDNTIEKLKADLGSSREQSKALQSSLFVAEKTLVSLRAEHNSAKAEARINADKFQNIELTLEKIQEENAEEKDGLNQTIEGLRTIVEEKEQLLSEASIKAESSLLELREESSKTQENLQKSIDSLQKQNEELRSLMNQQTNEVMAKESEIFDLKEKVLKLETFIESNKEASERSLSENKELKGLLEQQRQTIAAKDQSLEEMKQEILSLVDSVKEADTLRNDLELGHKSEVHALQEKIQSLSNDCESLRLSISRSREMDYNSYDRKNKEQRKDNLSACSGAVEKGAQIVLQGADRTTSNGGESASDTEDELHDDAVISPNSTGTSVDDTEVDSCESNEDLDRSEFMRLSSNNFQMKIRAVTQPRKRRPLSFNEQVSKISCGCITQHSDCVAMVNSLDDHYASDYPMESLMESETRDTNFTGYPNNSLIESETRDTTGVAEEMTDMESQFEQGRSLDSFETEMTGPHEVMRHGRGEPCEKCEDEMSMTRSHRVNKSQEHKDATETGDGSTNQEHEQIMVTRESPNNNAAGPCASNSSSASGEKRIFCNQKQNVTASQEIEEVERIWYSTDDSTYRESMSLEVVKTVSSVPNTHVVIPPVSEDSSEEAKTVRDSLPDVVIEGHNNADLNQIEAVWNANSATSLSEASVQKKASSSSSVSLRQVANTTSENQSILLDLTEDIDRNQDIPNTKKLESLSSELTTVFSETMRLCPDISETALMEKVGIFRVAFKTFELEKERILQEAQTEKEQALEEMRARLEEEKNTFLAQRCVTESEQIAEGTNANGQIDEVTGIATEESIPKCEEKSSKDFAKTPTTTKLLSKQDPTDAAQASLSAGNSQPRNEKNHYEDPGEDCKTLGASSTDDSSEKRGNFNEASEQLIEIDATENANRLSEVENTASITLKTTEAPNSQYSAENVAAPNNGSVEEKAEENQRGSFVFGKPGSDKKHHEGAKTDKETKKMPSRLPTSTGEKEKTYSTIRASAKPIATSQSRLVTKTGAGAKGSSKTKSLVKKLTVSTSAAQKLPRKPSGSTPRVPLHLRSTAPNEDAKQRRAKAAASSTNGGIGQLAKRSSSISRLPNPTHTSRNKKMLGKEITTQTLPRPKPNGRAPPTRTGSRQSRLPRPSASYSKDRRNAQPSKNNASATLSNNSINGCATRKQNPEKLKVATKNRQPTVTTSSLEDSFASLVNKRDIMKATPRQSSIRNLKDNYKETSPPKNKVGSPSSSSKVICDTPCKEENSLHDSLTTTTGDNKCENHTAESCESLSLKTISPKEQKKSRGCEAASSRSSADHVVDTKKSNDVESPTGVLTLEEEPTTYIKISEASSGKTDETQETNSLVESQGGAEGGKDLLRFETENTAAVSTPERPETKLVPELDLLNAEISNSPCSSLEIESPDAPEELGLSIIIRNDENTSSEVETDNQILCKSPVKLTAFDNNSEVEVEEVAEEREDYLIKEVRSKGNADFDRHREDPDGTCDDF